MSVDAGKDLAASVRARLLNKAKAEQTDFNAMLLRCAQERLLYRLSQSILPKGALLFTLWYDLPHRPTAPPPHARCRSAGFWTQRSGVRGADLPGHRRR